MGIMENRERGRVRKTRLQEALLRTLAGDRMAATAVIPAVLNSLFDLELPSYSRNKEVVLSAAARLKRRGLVEFKHGFYSLTRLGQDTLNKWQETDYRIHIPKRWDGKWRVVIFDIPEKRMGLRKRVREILSRAGFKMLQGSVWVLPYDCEDVIALMKTDLGIGKHLLYMIVDEIENDRHLRMDFDLLP